MSARRSILAGILVLLLGACAEPPADRSFAGAEQQLDAATTVRIVAPTGISVIPFDEGATVDVTVLYEVSGTIPDRLLCYRGDALDGIESVLDGGYVFTGIPMGEHRLTLLAADAAGEPIPGAEDSVVVRVAPPCLDDAGCDDENPCTRDSCIGQRCRYGPSGVEGCCASRFDCTAGPGGFRGCVDSSCVECTTAAQCDDGWACSREQCVAGQCVVTVEEACCVVDADCDDADPCTNERCQAGRCLVGEPTPGCCTAPTAPVRCDDGNPCTSDVCIGGLCRHGPPAPGCCSVDTDCDDGSPCTLDRCDPLLNACVFERDPATPACCEVHWDCDDGDPTTLDSCEESVCFHVPNGLYCDPDHPCAPPESETCMLAVCLANRCEYVAAQGCCTETADCGDDDACTEDVCRNNTCVYDPIPNCCVNDADCDDGNPCNLDRCIRGRCKHGPNGKLPNCCVADKDCRGGTVCSPTSCTANHVCTRTFDSSKPTCSCTADTNCDDGNPCTTDRCTLGECVYSDSGRCECTADADCDDGEACTSDYCVGDRCVHQRRASCCESDAACDDGNDCTVNTCDPGSHTCKLELVKRDGCCSSDPSCHDNDPATKDICVDFRCNNVFKPNYCKTHEDCVDLDPCTGDACIHGVCRRFGKHNAPPIVFVPSACCDEDIECGGLSTQRCVTGGCVAGFCMATATASSSVGVPYYQPFSRFSADATKWDEDCWRAGDLGEPAMSGWTADEALPLGEDRHITFSPPLADRSFDSCAVSPAVNASLHNYLTVSFEYAPVTPDGSHQVHLGAIVGNQLSDAEDVHIETVTLERPRLVTTEVPAAFMRQTELRFAVCVSADDGEALDDWQVDDFRIAATRPPEYLQELDDVWLEAGESFTGTISARDRDSSSTLVYRMVFGPAFVTLGETRFDPTDGSYDVDVSGETGPADVGDHLVRIWVFDGRVHVETSFVVHVTEKTCGDGALQATEECDDGDDNSDTTPDACRVDCKLPSCGDDVVDVGMGEACDDGEANSDTGVCTSECAVAVCGDAFVRDGVEECDDGGTADGDGCSATCRIEAGASCGDGDLGADEECDDGTENSDSRPGACRTNCRLPRCGDSVIDAAETCDDGTANSDTAPDACRTDCTAPRCGDGVKDSAEDCDPAAEGSAETCTSTCRLVGEARVCGNGLVEPGEECDQGELNDDNTPDACRTDCSVPICGDLVTDPATDEECDWGAGNADSSGCLPGCIEAVCGDGKRRVGVEECDDGNTDDDDVCMGDCRLPTPPNCGNGTVEAGERCDDGVDNSDTDPGACRENCQVARCGDGVRDIDERCDDGVDNDDGRPDACRTDCIHARCGDGVRDANEQCDDGNLVSGDGCSMNCRSEDNLLCGDGNIDADEQCDDAERNSDTAADACRTDCGTARCGDGVLDAGEECDHGAGNADSGECLIDCKLARCADGFLRAGIEECDDGNEDAGDGCDAFCRLEPGPDCGNGEPNDGEQCDTGADNSDENADACRVNCRVSRCGDGVVDSGERCDDADANSDNAPDACRTDCTPATCGDGVVDSTEQCDDGGAVSGDGCSRNCRHEPDVLCGNGRLDLVEVCDAGAANSDVEPDACRTDCRPARCGDGIVDSAEECDDGTFNGPDATCLSGCTIAVCGDGAVRAGVEECDDGNTTAADGCSPTCLVEPGPDCGDGDLDLGEECDDGAGNSDTVADACRTNCRLPRCGDGVDDRDERCDDGEDNSDVQANACRSDCVTAYCGDAIVDTGEACDDGNDRTGDGCTPNCRLEGGGAGGRCGDGKIDAGEECDAGPANSDTTSNACRTDCTRARCGDGVADSAEECDLGRDNDDDGACLLDCRLPTCGDGYVLEGIEECDDGNTTAGDGCDAICRREAGAACGDGDVDPGEECDAGAANSDTASGACRTNCRRARCGDGVHDPGERCDNGAANSNVTMDACRMDCSEPRCGDGVVDTDEECDDANDRAGDGCTRNCRIEETGPSLCGNGTVDVGEECDEGTANSDTDADACRKDCMLPRCGDGVVDGGEACDHGVWNDDRDRCLTDCTLSRCGDGYVRTGVEECDDGGFEDGDGCDAFCTAEVGPLCGNGERDPGEQCDDGRDNSDDEPNACRTNCRWPRCGDGVQDTSEDCDDGADNENGVPDACHADCTAPRCGDLLLDSGEECDDGDIVNGDGCSRSCVIEVEVLCGNDLIDPGEACDDGPGNSDTLGDTCRMDCVLPRCGDGVHDRWSGEECDRGLLNSDTGACLTDCVTAKCGDGFLQSSIEECDDGNRANDDGCSSRCRVEPGPECGDGNVDADQAEECDAGDDNSDSVADACRTNCRWPRCGDGVADTGEQCDRGEASSDTAPNVCRTDCRLPWCGDGVRDSSEQCDDGDQNSNAVKDSCRTNCKVAHCGDGVVDTGEACDDNNTRSGDGCSATCQPEADVLCGDGELQPGEECDDGPENSDTLANACRSDCKVARCGDGVVDSGEQCDAGAANSNALADACRTTCVRAGCGDGVVDNGEECDDGNTTADDGCSRQCKVELIVVPFPYRETFDERAGLVSAFWKYEGTPASAAGWWLSEGGALGPDKHPRTIFLGSTDQFEDRIVSPIVDCTGQSTVTVSWDNLLEIESVSGEFSVSLEVSTDGGATWQSAWTHAASAGRMPATIRNVDVSAYLANRSHARIAFVIAGEGQSDWIAWDVDTVEVRAGRPPRFTVPPSDVQLTAGDTIVLTVEATDDDTPAASLQYAIVGAPPFATLTDNGDGTASVRIAPSAALDGAWNDVAVTVSDGTFTESATFSILVTPAGGGGGTGGPTGITNVLVRNAPGGVGDVVGDLDVGVGGRVTFYAAGYDAAGDFIRDVAVMWRSTGTLEPVTAGPSTSVTLDLPHAHRQGLIVATPLNEAIAGDSTGTIRVLAPPPGPIDLARSSIDVGRTTLVSDGRDNTTVTVRLVDAHDTPITDPHAVVIATTGGTLAGSVINQGDGRYTQKLVSAGSEGTATITATVDGARVQDSETVTFVVYESLAGGLVIDCDNYAAYMGRNLIVDGVTVTLNTTPDCAPMRFGQLVVRNSGKLTHSAATDETVYTIDVKVTSLYVDGTSSINVDGRGYRPRRTFGNSMTGGPGGSRTGGSHGGRGGRGGGFTYDDFRDPQLPGGGSYYTHGGGVVRIEVLDESAAAVIDGTILARGANHGYGGGAGGAIRIKAPVISGTGALYADGGNGDAYWRNDGAAGGGGRVALVGFHTASGSFTADALGSHVFVRGGDVGNGSSSYHGYRGGAGTLYLASRQQGDVGDLIIDAANRYTNYASTPLLGFGGASEHLVAGELTDNEADWPANLYAGMLVNPNREQGGTVSLLDDALFRVTSNSQKGLQVQGDLTTASRALDSYRATYYLDHLEIRGAARVSADADFIVRGGDLHSTDSSVFELRGWLDGVGVLEFDRPLTEVRVTSGGLTADEIVVEGDADWPLEWTIASSSFDKRTIIGQRLTVNSSTVGVDTVAITGNVVLDGSSTVTVRAADVTVGGTLFVHGSSLLTHPAATADTVYTLDIAAHSVEVDSAARIDVSGRGYAAGRTLGNTTEGASTSRCGGSHGGLGGSYSGARADVYDSIYEPTFPGAGGAYGAGGGVIRIVAPGAVIVNGVIRANGAAHGYGGGAGGSIYIHSPRVGGAGYIDAIGGNGDHYWRNNGAAGGGGRIAIVGYAALGDAFALPTTYTNVRTYGGDVGNSSSSYSHMRGGAGTVFLKGKSDVWGHVVFDNGDRLTNFYSSPLVDLGTGAVNGVEEDTLTSELANWTDGRFTDYLVNPNVAQGDADTLLDDAFFRVAANDASRLTLVGENTEALPTDVSAVDATYRSVYVFQNLEIRGRARIQTTGDLLVLDGDLHSNDTTTFDVQGVLNAARVELNLVDHILSSNYGALIVDAFIGEGDPDHAFRYTLNGASLTKDVVHATQFSFANAAAILGRLIVSGEAVLDGSATVTINDDEVTVGGKLTVAGTSLLTHGISTTSHVYDLVVTADAVEVTSGARIDVSGRGYPAGRTWGNTTVGAAGGRCGGSHGGKGGVYSCTSPAVYGDLYAPRLPGGGGAYGAGGGRIALHVANTLAVDGAIRANGASHGYGGGAGGSVYVRAKRIDGNGTIDAIGGNGDHYWRNNGSSGGGGRIALLGFTELGGAFAYPAPYTNVRAWCGSVGNNSWGYRWMMGGAGSIYLKSQAATWGDLIVDNGGYLTDGSSTPMVDVGAGRWLDATADTLVDDRIDWPTSLYVDTWVNPDVSQGDETTLLDDVFYRVIANEGGTLTVDVPDGTPTPGELTAENITYRAVHVFDNLEVRGYARLYSAGDILVHQGDLHSDDTTTFEATGHLDLNRLEFADVDTLVTNAYSGLKLDTIASRGVVGYPFQWTSTGGWLDLHEVQAAEMTLTSVSALFDTLAVVGDLRLKGSTSLTVRETDVIVGSHLQMQDTALLTHPTCTTTDEYDLVVRAATAEIASGSRIDVSGRGYPAGRTWGNTTVGASAGRCGGSHGGRGGQYSCTPAKTYGNLREPRTLGSGGAYGAGGGRVSLQVTGRLTVNGGIYANGSAHGYGGGAGGSIHIRPGRLGGTGTLQAIGGNGDHYWRNNGSSGSGGRIAVVGWTGLDDAFALPTPYTNIRAYGGSVGNNSWSYRWMMGGAGTIYLKSATARWGDLILDNGGYYTDGESTPLSDAGPGVVFQAGTNTLQDEAADWQPNRLVGTWVNPDPTQGDPRTLVDDRFYRVLGNTTNLLTLVGEIGAPAVNTIASPGREYRPIAVFDNLEIRGRARLSTAGDVLVMNGDLTSADTTTFAAEGYVYANRLEFAEVDRLAFSSTSGFTVKELASHGQPAYRFDYDMTSSTIRKDVLFGREMAFTSCDVVAQRIDASSDLTFDGSTSVTVQGTFVESGGTLTLRDTALLTHEVSTTDTIYDLEVRAARLDIASGARIDVSGRGYRAGRTEGNTTGGASTGRCGGSHGGVGGRYSCTPAVPFDDLYRPRLPGGGGAYGAGGGRVSLLISGPATIDGAIRANGAGHGYGGGAGGSVYLKADRVGGSGYIDAIGGNGDHYWRNNGSSGAGGRIALVDFRALEGAFAYPTPYTNLRAWAGSVGNNSSGYRWMMGGAGTIYLKNATARWGDLIVDNGNYITDGGSTQLVDLPGGAWASVAARAATDGLVTWKADHFRGCWVNPNVGQGDPDTLMDDVFYEVETNTDDTLSLVVPDGQPAVSSLAGEGTLYRGVHAFDNVEIRGRARLSTAGDLLILKGDISSEDDATFAVTNGAVFAHQLEFDTVEHITGSGALFDVDVLVGDRQPDWPFRFTLASSTLALDRVRSSAFEATSSTITVGTFEGLGNVVLKGSSGVEVGTMTVAGNLALDEQALLTVTGTSLIVEHDVMIDGTARVTHPAATATQSYALEIDAENVLMGSAAVIDVAGRGYPARVSGWLDTLHVPVSKAGGSHGGFGGIQGADHPRAAVYDNLYFPRLPGGGGWSGAGGGVVVIRASEAVAVHGTITADGAGHSSGAGAGGTVRIEAPVVTGNGVIHANGGNADYRYGGAGGGGRIAILDFDVLAGAFEYPTPFSNIQARGGTVNHASTSYDRYRGGAGTLLLRASNQSWGDLIIDNGGVPSRPGATGLVTTGAGPVTGLTASELRDAAALWWPGVLVGHMVLPRAPQGTASLVGDVWFTITGNDRTSLTVQLPTGGPDLLDVTAIGDAFRTFYRFDNLEVRGNAKLGTDAALLVGEGDVASDDVVSFVVPDGASIDAHVLELRGVACGVVTGDVVADTLVCQ